MGIIDWTIDDIEQLNINAHKMLSMTVTSTQTVILIIYVSRSNGGPGKKEIRAFYESRIIAVHQHLL